MQIVVVTRNFHLRYFSEKITKEKKAMLKAMGNVYKVHDIDLLIPHAIRGGDLSRSFLPADGMANSKAGARIQNQVGFLVGTHDADSGAQILDVILREPNQHRLKDNKLALKEWWLAQRRFTINGLVNNTDGQGVLVKNPKKLKLERIWT